MDPPSVLELTLGAFPDVLMQFLTKPRDFAQFCITLSKLSDHSRSPERTVLVTK